ncbi:MAG: hypothetical protein GQ574_22950 [Crocinitomix sp.]|nr:hypothetical protein [Crocinitomix sp.]
MLKKAIFTILILFAFSASNLSIAQTDSTDLSLFMTDATILTAMDTMLYGDGSYEQLNLDFEVTDSVTFSKVHVQVVEVATSAVIFKKVYQLSYLQAQSLIAEWNVSIPLGNLVNTNAYQAAIIVEQYDGSLGLTITKTLNP